MKKFRFNFMEENAAVFIYYFQVDNISRGSIKHIYLKTKKQHNNLNDFRSFCGLFIEAVGGSLNVKKYRPQFLLNFAAFYIKQLMYIFSLQENADIFDINIVDVLDEAIISIYSFVADEMNAAIAELIEEYKKSAADERELAALVRDKVRQHYEIE